MSDLNVKLILSAVDRMSPALASAARQAQAFAGRMSGAGGFGLVGAAAANVSQQMRGVGAAAAQVGQRLAVLGTAGGLVGGGVFALLKTQVVDVAAQFERFTVQLTALEGSSEGAQQALAWTKEFAKQTPLELSQVVDAYAKLKAFGIDPTNGSLQALADTMAKSGRGPEDLNGTIMQLGQAWQKQKLQQEDILPLIERGVPVWELLSKAMQKPVPVLQEMASKGKLGRDAIAALIQAMGKDAAGASEAFAKTWDGQLSMLSDAWTNFGNAIAQAGVFDFLKEKLGGLLATIDRMTASGELQALAQTISGQLVSGLKEAWSAGQSFFGLLQDGWTVVKAVKDHFGSWTPILGAVAAVIAGPLIAAVAGMGAAFVTLGTVIGLTPIGWILGGLAAVTAAGVLLWKNWDSVTQGIVGAWEWAKGALGAVWDWIMSKIQPLVDAVNGAFGAVGRFFGPSGQQPAAGAPSAAAGAQSAVGAAAAAQKFGGDISVRFAGAPAGTQVTGVKASPNLNLAAELGPMGAMP